ncbi:hypothetical protein [Streptomyces sp. FH025]|uniref:hypothetical protein n=1 Tax=Streptomyces sp. FH025 TaxID=2815937 RepID=UPI001A9E7EA1|nr:hypothetical protein [Streptomyces sp. FH025]MBO1413094.1 hypothetical protein [Streptomyces sp. FH025]
MGTVRCPSLQLTHQLSRDPLPLGLFPYKRLPRCEESVVDLAGLAVPPHRDPVLE